MTEGEGRNSLPYFFGNGVWIGQAIREGKPRDSLKENRQKTNLFSGGKRSSWCNKSPSPSMIKKHRPKV